MPSASLSPTVFTQAIVGPSVRLFYAATPLYAATPPGGHDERDPGRTGPDDHPPRDRLRSRRHVRHAVPESGDGQPRRHRPHDLRLRRGPEPRRPRRRRRSEEHTSELQSLAYLVCRLLLEKKKNKKTDTIMSVKSSIL